MNNPTPKVGVLLLNWNDYENTAVCLASLRESAFRPYRILVFDNASSDGSTERLAAEFPEITLVRGEKNYGFAEGNNRGAEVLLEDGCDLLWILNNDTKVPPDCLGILVETLREHPEVAAVTAKLRFLLDPEKLNYAGATFNAWTFNTRFIGLLETDVGQYDTPGPVPSLPGSCILVRADFVRRIGLFNRDFFAYAEDSEWCLRARENGGILYYQPRAILYHRQYGASVKSKDDPVPKSSPRTEFLLGRNRALFIRLHTSPFSLRRLVAFSFHLFRRSRRAFGLLLLPSRRAAGRALFKGILTGLRTHPDPDACRLRRPPT